MRAERWWQNASVIQGLFDQPQSYDFVQAVRLLRHAPVKTQQHWSYDFNFRSSLNLTFPLTEIESLKLEDEQVHLTNLIIGLTGMQGALPYSYTNKIKLSGRHQRDETLSFLSLFNHKLTAQYVDASINYQLPIRYEIENENSYLNIIHALAGYVSEQHAQQELDDYFAEFSGLMQGQNNNAHALKTMLNCIFSQHFDITEFISEKFNLAPDQQTCLGGAHDFMLGINTFCGSTVRQIDEKIEIVIGPLTREDYLSFLPHQEQSIKLKKIIQTWCTPTLTVDVRLILKKQEIQPLCLSANSHCGLSQGAFLMPTQQQDNAETCYALIGGQ
ncbi:type VI secretion system baseplate subunit TssG [Acinetobacter cumulans]|uniref:Type VI secretion system baseplate subunit TssG n=1 Tax=Acinetobacter cumulans TaxID=2136182 RepID=A0A3A8FRH0_9GAMM|nr:type VI secretion system baseplate subunit TssG [Acinetobacter cumulans]RKG49565.1 type VI secretion system baseplate subunit TssG [Acinetobacter cumulans]